MKWPFYTGWENFVAKHWEKNLGDKHETILFMDYEMYSFIMYYGTVLICLIKLLKRTKKPKENFWEKYNTGGI